MSTKKLSRREFLNISALAGASAVLAACGNTTPSAVPTAAPAAPTAAAAVATAVPATVAPTAVPATAAAEVADLRFVWWGGQLRADVTSQVIKLFEEQNPDIKFSFEPLGFEEYWTKMTTQAAGGGLPDLMQHGSPTLVEWTANGFLEPLDPYIASGILETNKIPPALQIHGQIDGKIYGMSAGSNANGFVVDVDAFEQAGIEVPLDSWTWNDFEQVVVQLHEKLGIWGFGMYLHHIDMWRNLYTSAGSELFTPDKTALAYSDDQPLIDHLHMILRLQEAGAIPTLAEETEVQSQGPESQFIVTGQAAIDWLAGSNQLVAMWTAAGEGRNFKILPVPRIAGKQQGTGIRPSQYVAVTNSSKHPEAAVRFLNFFINSVEANKILNAERGVPINSEVLDALSNDAQPAQRAVYDYLSRLAQDTAPYSLIPDPLGIEDIRTNVYYPELTDPVRYGMISPEDAVANFRTKASEILAASN